MVQEETLRRRGGSRGEFACVIGLRFNSCRRMDSRWYFESQAEVIIVIQIDHLGIPNNISEFMGKIVL